MQGENESLRLELEEVRLQAPPDPIEELQLSVRAYNCLKRAQINLIREILPPQALAEIENLGQSSIEEIKERLSNWVPRTPAEAVRQELEEVRSQAATAVTAVTAVTADRDELRSRLEQQLATASKKSDAATILSDIRENQKNQPEQKSRRTQPKAQKVWTLKDIEEVLEAIRSPKQKTPTDAREPLNEG